MLQTTNHRIVQILLAEGANFYCNGGLYDLVNTLETELNITKMEAYVILRDCKLCNGDYYKSVIDQEIKKLNNLEMPFIAHEDK